MPENKTLSEKFKRELIERYGDSILLKTRVQKPQGDEVVKRIHEIENIDLRYANIDDLKERLILVFTGYVMVTPVFPAGLKLYRGRKLKRKPVNICELSYPPIGSVKTYRRVNRPGESMFYCSYARAAVLFELGLEAGDMVAISKWRTNSTLLVNNIGYTEAFFTQTRSKRECPKWGDDAKLPPRVERDYVIEEFLSRAFTIGIPNGEDYRYKISIAIAEKQLSHEMFGGLIYPAIEMNANADNFALRPTFVDDHMTFEQVEYIRVDKREDELKYEVTVLDFANSFTKDGSIEWKGRRPHWIIREDGGQLIMTAENGKWVARNICGEIVEPE